MTPESRHLGAARDQALVRTLRSGAGLPLATAFGAVASLPFVARALSSTEFGIFVAISGLFALLSVADLGVGAALTIRLSSALAAEDQCEAERVLAASLLSVSALGLGLAGLGAASVVVVPWNDVLGAPRLDRTTVALAVIALSVSLGLFVIGSLGSRILYGYQEGAISNAWMATVSLAGAGATVAVALANGPLHAFVWAALGTPALGGVALTLWVAFGSGRRARPNFRAVGWRDVRSITAAGGWFFVVTGANSISYQVDVLIVAAVLGAPAAGVFAVVIRIFGLIVQAGYPALLQLAPAFADARVKGDAEWIRSRLQASMGLALAATACGCALLILVGQPLVGLVLTPDLVPPIALLVAAAVWTTYSVATAPAYFLMHALGRVRAHALMCVAVVAINLPLSVLLTRQWGITGPLWGSLLSTFVGAGVPAYVLLVRLGFLARHKPWVLSSSPP